VKTEQEIRQAKEDYLISISLQNSMPSHLRSGGTEETVMMAMKAGALAAFVWVLGEEDQDEDNPIQMSLETIAKIKQIMKEHGVEGTVVNTKTGEKIKTNRSRRHH
jgi:hypothetical protein